MKKQIILIILFFTGLFSYAQTFNYEEGVKAYDEGEYEKSLDYFGREIKDNPKSYKAIYYRALIFKIQNKYAPALKEINNAIKYIPSKDKELLSGAYQIRGDIYHEIDNYDKCLEDYATAVKLTPENPDVYTSRGQIYFEMDQYLNAEEDYKHALKIDESLPEAYAALGRNYIFQKKYSEAEKVLNQLIKLAPDYDAGYKFRAQSFFDQKKYDEAIDDIFEALLLKNKDKRLRKIFIKYAAYNYPLSVSKVNAQIAAKPENEVWYFVRAQLFEDQNKYNEAITDYNKLFELTNADNKAIILSYKAKCFSQLGMHEQAIHYYTSAINVDSTDAYYFAYRGDEKRLIGNYKDAIEDFTKAITIEPRESWFYYRRGWIQDEFLNNNEAGLNDYTNAISINKNYAYTYVHRGRLYESKLNNPEKAKDDFERILAIDTIVDENSNCRHYALFHLGKNEEAIDWMNKIIAEFPSSGNYYDATCLYALMNKPKESLAYLKLAFQNGFRDFTHTEMDDDLNNIRNLPEFKLLLQEWKTTFQKTLKIDSTVNEKESSVVYETVSIPMKSKGSGTYEVPTKINDLKLSLIFDTGASDISISQTEVQFMLKNGYLTKNDITGTQKYIDANGNIEVGTKIILRNVDFGGMVLKNVNASVVHTKNAPLLFGQSALSKYGKITIDNEKKTITITKRILK